MTQRIFDIENEKDMADLWYILPDDVVRIRQSTDTNRSNLPVNNYDTEKFLSYYVTGMLQINWHDKTEITRPIQEATEQDIGKLCYFWEGKDFAFGMLKGIGDDSTLDIYCMEDGRSGIWFAHCRRLTKQEIEELC